jgi:hypothetical protein
MTFLHVAFLGGALAVAIPLALHLIMRQQPKHFEFPALRFLQLRESTNRRQMRLRHWLLLALRCAMLLLLAIALARPSILASGMLGDQEAPVAAALVFDTNPRMQYRAQNQTRLQAAQETGLWLLAQLPAESDVAVVESRTAVAAFAVDPGAARQRIDRLDASGMSGPLGTAIDAAVKLVHGSDKPRKEIYVFTDLTSAAWSEDAMRQIEQQRKQLQDIGIYLVDVGVEHPSNYGLGELQLSAEALPKNGTLKIQADLLHCGDAIQRDVELYLIDPESAKPTIRGQQPLSLEGGEAQRAEFQLRSLPTGVHQGYVKIAGEDALACDDTRWFTVEVRPAWRVLLVAPQTSRRKPADYALFLAEALAPAEFRLRGEAAFECDVISTDELRDKKLEDYSAVALIDPRPIDPAVWQKLHSYVSAGGGLGILLGHNAMPVDAFNTPLAQELLPARLVRQWRVAGETYLAPEGYEHPLLAKFRGKQSSIPWESFPVFRHWQLGDPAEGAGIVLRYSDGQPALVERPVGAGRVITMTTPVSDPATPVGRETWNLLPTGEEPWPFVVLANVMFHYLAGSEQDRFNYLSGETAVVHPDAAERHPMVSLTTPRGHQIRVPVDEAQNAIVVTSTETPGNYLLQAGGGERRVDLGFSVNLPQQVSQLDRASVDDLKRVFGDVPFRLAHNREEIDRSVSAGRVGQELFPYLIVLLALVLGCEQVLSNRFYQDYDASGGGSPARQTSASSTASVRRESRSASI